MKFRPRFSVRTLVIVVTLVCVYFATWEATKRYGVPRPGFEFTPEQDDPLLGEVSIRVADATSPLPLIIWQDEFTVEQKPVKLMARDGTVIGAYKTLITETKTGWHCYVWLFGPTIKLPFASTE